MPSARRARNVQRRKREVFGHIVGQLCVNSAFKQRGFGNHVHAVDFGVNRKYFFDFERREGEGHERRDFVSDFESRVGQILAYVRDSADKHTAAARDGVLHFAALGDNLFYASCDFVRVAAALVFYLSERGGVYVEACHVADYFVGVNRVEAVVDFQRRLREHALGLYNAVSSVFVSLDFHICRLLVWIKIF